MNATGRAGGAHAPRKRFGQHFLASPGIVAKIVDAIDPQPGDVVVEIGPGLGALTEPLLARLPHLHVIEIDRDIVARLVAAHAPERLTVHAGDVLDFDFGTLPDGLRIVGNLPYNISTPILFHLVAQAARVRDMHFMLQREVVDRMVAAPSTAEYGRLSVMLQVRFAMQRLVDVPPGAFRPPPKVDSAVVRLVPRADAAACDAAALQKVVTAAFTKRRKTLRNALAGAVTADALEALGLDPQLRPENLSVGDYVALSRYVPA
jgi:16S rRNA (adenine1518-N6/adenine1519-N6)-dimethyltransferase